MCLHQQSCALIMASWPPSEILKMETSTNKEHTALLLTFDWISDSQLVHLTKHVITRLTIIVTGHNNGYNNSNWTL